MRDVDPLPVERHPRRIVHARVRMQLQRRNTLVQKRKFSVWVVLVAVLCGIRVAVDTIDADAPTPAPRKAFRAYRDLGRR